MKKTKTKKLGLNKLKVAQLDRLDKVNGGFTSVLTVLLQTKNPRICPKDTDKCHTHDCPGTTIIGM
ncbi:hypothetical protein M0D21_16855 [Aquimarina sp. D1M17]|uniref:hypothetical protein n=1 Tax=Aquimarina acroporae TaxID=2937283 RepID=UPI0020BE61E9|nr:hypothetical protein [Aquimarina acroporae]MCK8523252.1 hypothetical protein [Aquimarina acroporae]